MKKLTRNIVSIIITITIISSLTVPAFASEGLTQSNFEVITQETNQDLKTGKQIAQWNDSILYTLVTPEISYCSQTTADGNWISKLC